MKRILVLLLFIFLSSAGTFAQQASVSGTVKDPQGNPITGATVLVKGTSYGTLTDIDGKYTVQTVVDNSILVFSFIGMTTQEVLVGGRSTVDITLAEGAIGLDEIIVVGYGTQTKKTLSGAVSSVSEAALQSSVAPSVSQRMVGKIAGVSSRITDGRPGGTNSLQIRNYGTPLFIIDGIPRTESDFNNLGPNDIESVSVLKDASASIYGLLAANGVVLVTTKMGKSSTGKTNITIDGYYGLQQYTRFPHPPNAYEYMLGLAESDQNRGIGTTITQQELDRWKEGLYEPENGLDYRSFDYYDMVFKERSPYPQRYINVGANGSTDIVNYYISVSNVYQGSALPSHYYKRTNLQSNIEAKLAQGLKVGTQISARHELRHSSGLPGWDDYNNMVTAVLRMWPTERPYANDNPLYPNQTHSININPATFPEQFTGFADNLDRVLRGNVYTEYDFKNGLKAKATFGYGYSFDDDEYFEYTYDAYTYDRVNDKYNVVVGGGNQNPFRAVQRTTNEDLFGQFQLNYNKKIEKHSVSAVAAYELSSNRYTFFYVHTVPPTNYIIPQYFANQDALDNQYVESARASVIGRFNYNYDERYLVEILGRYDGSYLYAPGKRWGLFPGISVGWRISNENFFEPLKGTISELKLRASRGKSGSESGVSAFGYQDGFTWGSGNYIFNGTTYTGIAPRGLPVTNLSWVTNITTNIGIDMTLFNGKIDAQFDAFERRVTGIPAPRYDVLLPSEVGYSLPNENLNSAGNYGVEGIITYNGTAGQVKYSVGINGTIARRRDIETYKPRFGNSYDEYRNSNEDRWSNVNWGYHILGQFKTIDEIAEYPVNIDGQGNRSLLPGDLIYEDLNGDKIINSLDQIPIGFAAGGSSYSNQTGTRVGGSTLTPIIAYGLNSSLQWKSINLVANFAGGAMQTFILANDLKIPYQSNGASTQNLITDRWHRSDPFDPNSDWIAGYYPPTRKDVNNHSNFSRTNDFYLTNIAYLRLRDLEIGYNLPASLLQKVKIESFRVYTNISSLFSIDNVSKYDIDPEINVNSGLTVPQTRVFNFGFIMNL
jgi:TonB-linked SusC/RagA family outer membrane protein